MHTKNIKRCLFTLLCKLQSILGISEKIHFAEAVEDIPKWHNVVIGVSVTVGAIIALLIITVLIKRRTPSMRVVELGFCKLCRKKEEPEVDYVRMNE